MTDFINQIFEFTRIKKALVQNFRWLIHVSPEKHLGSINEKGLIASRDAYIPTGLNNLVPDRHILCLHPLGAKMCPLPVCKTVEDEPEVNLVTLAVAVEELPERMHSDWSNAWQLQEGRISLYESRGADFVAKHLIAEFGSVVSYDAISPEKLRVFCVDAPPADPLRWSPLTSAADKMIHRYKKPR